MLDGQKFPTEALKSWFLMCKRDFPWRQDPSPYEVWISEMMLQQTLSSVVVDYFNRWMERFPDIQSLADAPFEEVVKLWEGLGYYQRAKYLHEGAKQICLYHEGRIPSVEEALKKIKGIGPYTLGAILSFAFHKKKAAVDGNVLRVISRYFLINEPIDQAKTKAVITKIVEDILPDREPHVIMEAFIELGAVICKKQPICLSCPIRHSCLSYQNQKTKDIPKKSKKISTIYLQRDVYIFQYQNAFLIKNCLPKGLMANLYEFPYLERDQEQTKPSPWIISGDFVRSFPLVKHSFTKYAATLFPHLFMIKEKTEVSGFSWIESEKLRDLPFSAGHKKILDFIF